ncbi:hypothetical protein [Diaphorobacter sp.]|uniref:hypothetical protein n=1 Tax=Diaphorobacter sp. TaxID=1934310 RepID=UPI0028A98A52|nr:hypothetical protein [Diaphorobacter sp.]
MDDFETRVLETMSMLSSSCREWGILIAGDGSVAEPDAERLLGYSERALKQQRTEGRCPIPRRQVGNRWRYRLRDLAVMIETRFDDT